ncbi:MAG: pyrroline-5-carboxylate reductase [Deltaproteobacteria bacterium CG_4_10_14_0_2_um_filter_43_8]|nr:MAG: pyrroline-5-carboxylate reductase [Deltaproteobacteria bacterium CG11_big_fil_rev_8_21_14_0_20_42_23]PJA19024.1 MAG: pyrroline-5-carboxylate reductase [Deltaproteobacteria bacterium CG_4_10_14_0_2_um_filter_43_8]PJC64351.1 MAG: pyrroline-5-carboxylate reductase [Deltaproteobacteria bacterium CG_4_9_14_0_2_um_filter_42_21]
MKKLALLGCGNMGTAIALGVSKHQHGIHVFTYDPDHKKSLELADRISGTAVKSYEELKECDAFLLACKPQQFKELATQLKKHLSSESLVLSIMAGVSTKTLSAALPAKKLVRVMPNTPCLIGKGVCGIYALGLSESEEKEVHALFSPISKTYAFSSDDEIDKVTAITGSGPAYVFEFARVLSKAFSQMGIAAEKAEDMVKQLFVGSSALMQEAEESIETLRNQVTSKGGTTEAALNTLHETQFEDMLTAATQSAYKRAKELS